MATRHLLREIILQSLYEWDFYNKKVNLVDIFERNLKEFAEGVDEPEFGWKILGGIVKNIDKIDQIINECASEWPLKKITLIDRNILRIGIYELLFSNLEEVPYKVAIDESVKLAKYFGGINSPSFINGILGTVYNKYIEKNE